MNYLTQTEAKFMIVILYRMQKRSDYLNLPVLSHHLEKAREQLYLMIDYGRLRS